jgi:bifunctional DNase/RNase
MAELRIHAFSWCVHHQQPVIGLTTGSDEPSELFWVGLSPEDAQALCQVDTWPPSGRRRVHKLVSDILRATDSRIRSISLSFSGSSMLNAEIGITTPAGNNVISCSSVDAILLASEHHLPLSMDDRDWQRLISYVDAEPDESPQPDPATQLTPPPDIFRDFIETLDLDQERDI